MEVLGLCSYPLEAASTRYRLMQFAAPLAERKISLTVVPFLSKTEFAMLYQSGQTARKAFQLLNAARKRLLNAVKTRRFDCLLIQRETMLFGPPIVEWIYKSLRKYPLILDLDDATYVRSSSPTYGRLGEALKCFGKTDKLIDWSETVICGNQHIAKYVESRGAKAVVVPTVVNTDQFHPIEKDSIKTPVIGWVGTHSTFPLLAEIFPVLQDLAQDYDFTLRIVGAGRGAVKLDGVRVENLDWRLEREVQDFQSLDIGLYPLEATEKISNEWLAGKSGFKAIQYMTVGIPFVVTPLGICGEIGIQNETHFAASNKEQWFAALAKLLKSYDLRVKMGKAGRNYALKHFTVGRQADIIADVIHEAIFKSQRVNET